MGRAGTFGAWIAVGLLAAGTAGATPRYSMAVGQNCNLCHLNPTGGGVRDPYATQYLLPTRLAMQLHGKPPAGANPVLGETGIVVGADLRTMWLNNDKTDTGNNFREMQGSLYLYLPMPDPRFSVSLTQDFGQVDASLEVYGMGYILPWSGYVKAGRFIPAFGWHFSDHRTFTRRNFVFLPVFPPHDDTGLEVGVYPGPFSLEASVLNGAFDPARKDNNDSVAGAARGGWRGSAGPLQLSLGGSWYGNPKAGATSAIKLNAVGPFAGVKWGRLIWVGEADWSRREPRTGTNPSVWGFATSHEVSFRLVQGLDAFGTYDLFDPDKDYSTGSYRRVGFGVDALTYPFLQLEAKVNIFTADAGDAPLQGRPTPTDFLGAEFVDHVQTEIQIHFIY